MNISVVGLGKLGLPMAAVLAHKGCNVIGVDSNAAVVAAVNEGRAPVREPGLDDLLATSRITATEDIARAVSETDTTFVVVPTPSTDEGEFSNDAVLDAVRSIGRAIAEKETFHLVVLSSTVVPGTADAHVVPALEQSSRKICGSDFGLCYSPEFIALGSVIHDLLEPDLILIGESDAASGDLLVALYEQVCENTPHVARMNYVNAELTKLAINTFVTAKISFANMIADLAEVIPGADADEVTAAVGMDTRIGSKYLTAAVPYGGPCFPRDNIALAAVARRLGRRAPLAEAADDVNRCRGDRLVSLIESHLKDGDVAGVLGLSYKPDTDVVDASTGVHVAQLLRSRGIPVVVFDPEGLDHARDILGDGITFAASMEECARRSRVLTITTPWAQFRELRPRHLDMSLRPVVIDCWGILPAREFEDPCEYVRLGRYLP